MAVKDIFYLSLGSSTLCIDDAIPARKFLQFWKQTNAVPTVNSISGRHDTIYDFYGFPKSMYQRKYPAPGSPHLANCVKQLLTSFGFGTANVKSKDILVCQLSIQMERDAAYHYNMGRAMTPLMDENVLIVGVVQRHPQLKGVGKGDTWVKDTLLEGRYEDVNKYAAGPGAKAWQIHDSWELGALSYASYQFYITLNLELPAAS
ncbi:extradiol ring-cleavage dioxygenase-like [Pyrus ussuriensis x Pyrus communis]|uniref:Extradiol ring-cleavage dioxygenase-like n=1 Tax=Pyrus ussuriensis x Pyrus communis TaxID=2448454 RepID=A0A5N5GZ72_9ROSA|nr:extradiol ring-cleavage dioxygenase-like [Pyrus ussuriensis x Pyrus communis]